MTLATALRQRALLARTFGLRAPRVRPTLVKPARFPRGLVIAYLKGIREILDVITQSIAQRVLPQLPRLVSVHASSRIDQAPRRIAIVGAPRAGKTTQALELGARLGLPVHHSDDLIQLGWSEASDALAQQIAATDHAIFEGVAVVRALRKLLTSSPDRPVDQVLVLRKSRVGLNDGQARMAVACETILREILPALQSRGVEVFEDPDRLQLMAAARMDNDPGGEVKKLFDDVSDDVDKAVPEKRIAFLAQQNALRVAAHSASEVDKQIKQVVKIDVHAPNTGLNEHINAFVAQNVALIKGLTQQTQAQTHAVVLEGLRQGLRHEEIAKNLKTKVGLSETKATMIAGDQVGKLHGECTQLRQTALGIKRYRWATSRDELVRHSHRVLDGTIQEWAKPPIVNPKTGLRAHPGVDTHYYPCRCSGIPIVDDLLQDAGLIAPPVPTVALLPPSAAANDPRTRLLPLVPKTLPRPRPSNVPSAAQPSRPPLSAAPHWMTAPNLNVVADKLISGGAGSDAAGVVGAEPGANVARLLTMQTAEGERRAVWKPAAGEEAGLRDGIRAGTYYQREAAVSDLSEVMFGAEESVVPRTVARTYKGEVGSLQAFVSGAQSTNQLADELEAAQHTIAETPAARRVFLLDAITRNTDRHGDNLLWQRVGGSFTPVAIDNGLALAHGAADMPFNFAINTVEFQKKMLDLDEFSQSVLKKLDLGQAARVLRKQPGIEPVQVREALARIKALQKNPQQLRELGTSEATAHPQTVAAMRLRENVFGRQPEAWAMLEMEQWLALSPDARGLTAAELAEIDKLSGYEQ